MLKSILGELREHAPFTLVGALTGIALMMGIVLGDVRPDSLEPVFEQLHALHVLLSAIVTTGLYRRYRTNLVACAAVGFVGAVGIATLSDIVFPHHGGVLLLKLTAARQGMRHIHVAFIEEWYVINPAALLGVALGIAWPRTKIPHAGHVLLSTWASLFYLAAHVEVGVAWLPRMPLVLVVLFVAVWVPCCVSDIVFPMLFVGSAGHGHEADR